MSNFKTYWMLLMLSIVTVKSGIWPPARVVRVDAEVSLDNARTYCADSERLVSIQSAEHVLWLKELVVSTLGQGSLSHRKGIPLGYDYTLSNSYFDLNDNERSVQPIFDKLRIDYGWIGDYQTDQSSGSEHYAGFGWHYNGIEDWPPGYTSAVICETPDEVRLAKLEAAVEFLQLEVEWLKTAKIEMQKRLAACNNIWTLKRTQVLFEDLEKLKLHESTPTYVEKMPIALPENTRAVIISVFCNFWNKEGGAYLDMNIQQQGNVEGGVVTLKNTHWEVHANTFYYEVFVSWDNTISDKLEVAVTHSHQSGGDDNWYRIRMVGYVMV